MTGRLSSAYCNGEKLAAVVVYMLRATLDAVEMTSICRDDVECAGVVTSSVKICACSHIISDNYSAPTVSCVCIQNHSLRSDRCII